MTHYLYLGRCKRVETGSRDSLRAALWALALPLFAAVDLTGICAFPFQLGIFEGVTRSGLWVDWPGWAERGKPAPRSSANPP